MMRVSVAAGFSLALAGCSAIAPTPAPQAAAPAAPLVAAAPSPAAPAVVAAPLAAPARPVSGALLGPVGQGLDQKDLDAAYKAQLAALDSGKRSSWRGQKGVFGYVEVGAEGGLSGGCRDYTHVIYVGGRPRNGKGSACRQPSGEWTTSS